MKLNLLKVILDQKAQPRTELNSETIQEYAQVWKDGGTFPEIVVFSDGDNYWLADGWHRLNAAKVAHMTEIEADVKPGTLRDAILYSVSANAVHGMRRTNADKRRAVMALLNDSEWSKWSDREIARRCAVDHKIIATLRPVITGEIPSDNPQERQYIDRWGNTSTMQVNRIGEQQAIQPIKTMQNMDISDSYESKLATAPTQEHKSHFNHTNENIDWAHWSWNPVTGCEHDCEYCYARDIANRFYPEKFIPTFHPERLDAPKNTNPDMTAGQGGKSVFVCSMSDLFGAWVPNDWIWQVMDQVKNNPQWTFIFLTKNPRRLASVNFPDNAWVGCTVDKQARVKPAEEAMRNVTAKVRFISCEPMLEELKFNDLSMLDWIIIGAQSKTTQCPEFQPNFWWVNNLTNQAKQFGCKVFWKPNFIERPKEYPAT